jgi:TrmH family RNA methyltransferase
MLSKNRIKLIQSLSHRKNRDENELFIAEGPKLIKDLEVGFQCEYLFFTEEHEALSLKINAKEKELISKDQLDKISLQKNPQGILAVFRMRKKDNPDIQIASKELVLMLDDIQDPGNLGTIIRIADWFGIQQIFCSVGTADVYNPKVIQATMGALARVQLSYINISETLSKASGIPVYGTFLEGKNIYGEQLTPHGIIILGNEGNGISPETASRVTSKLLIPGFPADIVTSESLNVAVATGIVCAEFRRRIYVSVL